MTTPTVGRVAVDVEAVVRAWARAALTPAPVHFGMPKPAPDLVVVMKQVGGFVVNDSSGLDRPLISFSCWGATKATAAGLKARLVAACAAPLPYAAAGGYLHSAEVELGGLWLPDPGPPERPRYVVDVRFVISPALEGAL